MDRTIPSKLIIATRHRRNHSLVANLKKRLIGSSVIALSSPEELVPDRMNEIAPDIIFFPHWSWMIPKNIYERYECIIFHMTDLPYGRGGSPLQNLIVRGHKETMLSAFRCVAGLDAGPVYLKTSLRLEGTAEQILQRAAVLVENMIVDIVENRPAPIPQEGEVVEFKRRQPEDGNIATLETLEQVYDYIRMLDADGYPPAFIQTPHLRFDFSQSRRDGEFLEAKVRVRRRTDE